MTVPDDRSSLAVADKAKGFMPDIEAVGLRAAASAAPTGVMLEVGSYCGKSAVHLGVIARQRSTLLFSVDHHRGSEENQAGWQWHDQEVVDARVGKMDTLPFFRATVHDAGLEGTVVALVGESASSAARGRHRLPSVSLTAATAAPLLTTISTPGSPMSNRGDTWPSTMCSPIQLMAADLHTSCICAH